MQFYCCTIYKACVASISIAGTIEAMNLRKMIMYWSTLKPSTSSSASVAAASAVVEPSSFASAVGALDPSVAPPVTLLTALDTLQPFFFFFSPATLAVPEQAAALRCSSITDAFMRSITFFITLACLHGWMLAVATPTADADDVTELSGPA